MKGYEVVRRTKEERRERRLKGLAKLRKHNRQLGETQALAARIARATKNVSALRRGAFTMAAGFK